MAPIRGRAGFRGRGRGGRGGRGGRDGRGGRGGRGRGGARGGFKAGRVQDVAEVSDASEQSSAQESDKSDHDDISEDESSDEEVQAKLQAYTTLLQSFQASAPQDKHRHKRRKIEEENEDIAVEDADDHIDPQDEPEVAENDLEEADEDETDVSDPFEVHFANPDDNILSRRLKAAAEGKWAKHKTQLGTLGSSTISLPMGEKPLAKRPIASPKQLNLKNRLSFSTDEIMPEFDSLQANLAPHIFEYQDILFGNRTVQNAESLRRLACLHALNHIYKTRDRVIKNSSRISMNPDDDAEYRDQGFTRPKVLILLETMQSCIRYVDTLMELCDPEQQENKKRFQDSYIRDDGQSFEHKPDDFRELFEGNNENHFRMGLKFTRKTVKYFSQFYASDVIFASPLGLRHAIEPDGKKRKKADHDFLSSIELVIVDQADAMLMQNWEHLEYCFERLNLPPQDSHGCDFSRVRSWYLDNNAKYLRQNIILSAFLTPQLKFLYSKYMLNVAGKIEYAPEYEGCLSLGLSVKQTFSRFDSPNMLGDPDARFKYFSSAIVPSIARLPKPAEGGQGVLVFIPEYFDFVRVRNYFANSPATQNISFGLISEYAEPADNQRARSRFMTGSHSVLLYSGRAHHFYRYVIRGVKRVIMYQLPDNPRFYEEIVRGFLGLMINEGKLDPAESNARVLFSKADHLRLERVVGSKRVKRMLTEKGDTFDFI